ncbi:Transcription elongation factor SPT5 [Mycena indigotica]|uniref:Transcription elongation factor SPT5 n=1 Tax=Mycena indigotica TaxID=2126181 RepID=A0A8H6TEP4_9AGAR|nr:Transcription elongation factor SPT5 [Mycena indigotica]KAF7315327.1 Transcription elongation factor SPT5 [Mycena indigotica]
MSDSEGEYAMEQSRQRPHANEYEDEREEDEEDDDDEEDEDEEDERPKKKKARNRRHRKGAADRFLDLAAVSDDDDDPEDDMDEEAPDFIDDPEDVEDSIKRPYRHLPPSRFEETDEQSLEQIASDIHRRYQGQSSVRYTGDMNEIPQRLLMPSVHDASLWQVRVKIGRERELVFSLMRKALDTKYGSRPLQILSAFQRDSLPGMIYVEARSSQQVSHACNGLVGVYLSRGIHLVPIEEMASLLQIKTQEQTVTPGSWVRIKRGIYQGDLAQVVDITETGEYVGVKYIPRIDLNPRDDASLEGPGKKRKKSTFTGSQASSRPPPRLFNYEEVVAAWGRKNVVKRNQVYVFQNETYKDGFLEKDLKLSQLVLEDVNPTLEEITQFARRQDIETGESVVDLSIIADASRKAAISVLQPGDHVEVFEGEQTGVHGIVEEINQDVVTITAEGVDFEGQKVDLPARSVRKRFKAGDHVKVMTGQNADETGLVVSVLDNVVTFLSDMTMQEVSVFSKDLREAAEVGSSTNIVGNYELHDLVQLDAQTYGVIFKTERDSFRVLDQHGQVRLVQPHQISMRRDSNRAIATDSEGHELRINDNMKETEGEGRKGRVLHIHQAFHVFLHNRDITENGGVFVARARSLASVAPKGSIPKAGMDLSKMNPALVPQTGGMVGSGNMGRGPRDRLIGVAVTVVKGPYKGYVGIIKDTNGAIARVELQSNNKVVAVDKEKLKRRLDSGKLVELEGYYPGGGFGRDNSNMSQFGGSQASSSSFSGGKTPGWGGRTPGWESGRTPGWNASRTPNPYAQGNDGKTPAWSAASKTPNPYAMGGRTPAWNANSSSTPNPYATANTDSSWGGATPGRPTNWGGATPGRPARAEAGWASPRPWGDSNNTWNAPTPAAAAPTPGFTGAPTPASAPTPGVFHVPSTPAGAFSLHGSGSGMSAPTPGAMSAPTPAAYPSYNQFQMPIEYEPPENWVFDPAYAHQINRIIVRVHGTRSTHPHYLDGQYEGREAQILAATKSASNFEQTVMIIVPGEGLMRSGFLAKYLLPVEPDAENQEALVLEDNKHKGEVVKVRETPDADSRRPVLVSPLKSSEVFEVTKDRLPSAVASESVPIETAHEDMIHDAQLDYYGKRLATCSSDRTVKVFDVIEGDTQKVGKTLTGHTGPVWQVAWAHPKFGSILASCSYDGKVLIWKEQQPSTGWSKIREHTLHTASVNSVSWAPHELGAILACASSDGKISVLTFKNDDQWGADIFPGHAIGCNAVSWAPATTPGSLITPAAHHLQSIPSALPPAPTPPIKRFASAGCDNLVKIWAYREDQQAWVEEDVLDGHTDWVRDVAWAPSVGLARSYIATASQDRTVCVWVKDAPNGQWTRSTLDPASAGEAAGGKFPDVVWRVSWSLAGNLLAVSCGDGKVTLWKENLKGVWECVSDMNS